MPTSLIIVDDFLESPDLLREVALKQEYPVPEIPAVYPGRNSKYNQLINGYDQRISQLAGEPLKPVSGDGVFGKFRLALEGDKGTKGVHVDNAQWTAILYLTLPEDCQDGTHFFRHIPSGTDRAPLTLDECKAMGCNSFNEFWDNIMHPHTNDPTKWEKIMTAPMRYNRLVMLRPQQWHDAGLSFGTDVTNGRLIYLTGYNSAIA